LIRPLLLACFVAMYAWAQAPIQETNDPNQALRIPIPLGEGLPVARVYVHIVNPPPQQASEVRDRIAAAYSVQPGSEFRQVQAEYGLKLVESLPEVLSVEHRLYQWDSPGELQVALIVRLRDLAKPQPAEAKQGLLQSRDARDVPRIYASRKALLKVIVQPSLGFYLEQNVWLGNSESFTNGPKPRNVAWPEMAQEVGVGGITQLETSPSTPMAR
jgi:hypothetical protein